MTASSTTAEPSAAEPVVVREDGNVLVITLNRPHVRNAIDIATAERLSRALDHLDETEAIRCGVILGEGDVFCAGMDLKAMARGEPRPVTADRGGLGIVGRGPVKPLVAGVQGAALGGGFEVALSCDVIVAADTAQFGLPEVRRGQVAGGGGAVRLPHRVPFHIAAEMLLTGEPITAARAASLGLVSAVVARADLIAMTLETAGKIASNAPLAVQGTKKLLHATMDWPGADAIRRQEPIINAVRTSKDAAEGARAFAEKRPPIWRGA
jgi:enoyl-CoA hydratase/carnithine racemase